MGGLPLAMWWRIQNAFSSLAYIEDGVPPRPPVTVTPTTPPAPVGPTAPVAPTTPTTAYHVHHSTDRAQHTYPRQLPPHLPTRKARVMWSKHVVILANVIAAVFGSTEARPVALAGGTICRTGNRFRRMAQALPKSP
ncbi:MAG UNVERIFIED_CONTAM: hypothetical protein LVT10_23475 [Anaerolineae bacterium]|jgi:hypothetical protein